LLQAKKQCLKRRANLVLIKVIVKARAKIRANVQSRVPQDQDQEPDVRLQKDGKRWNPKAQRVADCIETNVVQVAF
jgi:hypothetical protein